MLLKLVKFYSALELWPSKENRRWFWRKEMWSVFCPYSWSTSPVLTRLTSCGSETRGENAGRIVCVCRRSILRTAGSMVFGHTIDGHVRFETGLSKWIIDPEFCVTSCNLEGNEGSPQKSFVSALNPLVRTHFSVSTITRILLLFIMTNAFSEEFMHREDHVEWQWGFKYWKQQPTSHFSWTYAILASPVFKKAWLLVRPLRNEPIFTCWVQWRFSRIEEQNAFCAWCEIHVIVPHDANYRHHFDKNKPSFDGRSDTLNDSVLSLS